MPTLDNFSLGNFGLSGFEDDKPLTLIGFGVVVSSSGTGSTVYKFVTEIANGTTYNIFVASNFPRIPKFILVKRDGEADGIFIRNFKNSNGNSFVSFNQFYCAVMGSWYVNATGFRLPVTSANVSYAWEAYG